jgi:cytoskeletal protein CcmA (bactofilin family)
MNPLTFETRRRHDPAGERGIALATTIVVMGIVSVIVASLMGLAISAAANAANAQTVGQARSAANSAIDFIQSEILSGDLKPAKLQSATADTDILALPSVAGGTLKTRATALGLDFANTKAVVTRNTFDGASPNFLLSVTSTSTAQSHLLGAADGQATHSRSVSATFALQTSTAVSTVPPPDIDDPKSFISRGDVSFINTDFSALGSNKVDVYVDGDLGTPDDPGDLNACQGTEITGNLYVTGNAVLGTTDPKGSGCSVKGKIWVKGNLTLNSPQNKPVSYDNDITVGGDLTMNGDYSVTGNLYVNGNLNITATPGGTALSGSVVSYTGDIKSHGDITMNGNFRVQGAVIADGNVSMTWTPQGCTVGSTGANACPAYNATGTIASLNGDVTLQRILLTPQGKNAKANVYAQHNVSLKRVTMSAGDVYAQTGSVALTNLDDGTAPSGSIWSQDDINGSVYAQNGLSFGKDGTLSSSSYNRGASGPLVRGNITVYTGNTTLAPNPSTRNYAYTLQVNGAYSSYSDTAAAPTGNMSIQGAKCSTTTRANGWRACSGTAAIDTSGVRSGLTTSDIPTITNDPVIPVQPQVTQAEFQTLFNVSWNGSVTGTPMPIPKTLTCAQAQDQLLNQVFPMNTVITVTGCTGPLTINGSAADIKVAGDNLGTGNGLAIISPTGFNFQKGSVSSTNATDANGHWLYLIVPYPDSGSPTCNTATGTGNITFGSSANFKVNPVVYFYSYTPCALDLTDPNSAYTGTIVAQNTALDENTTRTTGSRDITYVQVPLKVPSILNPGSDPTAGGNEDLVNLSSMQLTNRRND